MDVWECVLQNENLKLRAFRCSSTISIESCDIEGKIFYLGVIDTYKWPAQDNDLLEGVCVRAFLTKFSCAQ